MAVFLETPKLPKGKTVKRWYLYTFYVLYVIKYVLYSAHPLHTNCFTMAVNFVTTENLPDFDDQGC